MLRRDFVLANQAIRLRIVNIQIERRVANYDLVSFVACDLKKIITCQIRRPITFIPDHNQSFLDGLLLKILQIVRYKQNSKNVQ